MREEEQSHRLVTTVLRFITVLRLMLVYDSFAESDETSTQARCKAMCTVLFTGLRFRGDGYDGFNSSEIND